MPLTDLVFPKRCAGCNKTGTYFCQKCVQNSKPHFPQVCPICERGSIDGLKHSWCQQSYSPDGLMVIWSYEGVPRKLIHKLKYRFVSNLATEIGSRVADFLKNYQRSNKKCPIWKEEKFLVVPIPLHWMRKNWRGFNHCEEVARVIVKEIGWELINLLVRKKMTKTQVGLKGEQRQKNVEGAFTLNPDVAISRFSNILLFDDVWTTGATILEATKALKKAGLKKVWCLTLAK